MRLLWLLNAKLLGTMPACLPDLTWVAPHGLCRHRGVLDGGAAGGGHQV